VLSGMSISPFLFCADAAASAAFLVEAFGFQPESVDRDETGKAVVATVRLGEYLVYLARPHEGRFEPPKDGEVLHSLVMVMVDDVDAVFARAERAGARIQFPPKDMDYGQRECGLRDLDGHYWSFATPLG
jgi:uncharacterized glyoxalase superfamily protein PhnB